MMNAEVLKRRILAHSIPVTESGCWLWEGATTVQGYGVMWDGEKNSTAHRIALLAFNGPFNEKFTVDHLCRVRGCVNPDHLEAVPHATNLLRGNTFNAAQVGRTHCPRGHEYTDINTNRWGGMRRCRSCDREKHREKRLKETEA